MNNKNSRTNVSDPSAKNYSDKMNNKAHSKSPFTEDEPSTKTTYK